MAARVSKRRKLTPPRSDDDGDENDNDNDNGDGRKGAKKIQKAFFKSAVGWNLEQDYESRPRKGKKEKKESTRLPIKTADGRLEQMRALEDDDVSVDSDGDWLEGRDDEFESPEPDQKPQKEPEIPEHLQILQAKEELAKVALALNENPEENGSAFKALAKVGQSKLVAVQKLALVTQMAVYKDVIPGYRIRPMAEAATQEQLSKDVRKLWAYEQSLVAGYQSYVKQLSKYARTDIPSTRKSGQSISSVAITCACTLVNAVPHFNFRAELLKIVIGKLSRRKVDADFVRCREALERLFRDDEEGKPSLEAVSLLSKMTRTREYRVDESVINLFLHLRLLSEFAGKGSHDDIEHEDGFGPKSKKPKEKREFRTKKERKAVKEQKSLDKDMAHADALVSHEERERMQSESLKLVFATYFRILKERVPHLMGAVLEGLAKYSHLINQDFFGDLLEALKDLIRHAEEDEDMDEEGNVEEEDGDDDSAARNTSREALLCTVTAFALLAGQDAHNSRGILHLDLSHFTTHLFKSLFTLSTNPDLELTSKSLHLPDPHSSIPHGATLPTAANRVNLQTTTVLLIRCLTAVLLPPYNIRSVPPLRLAAFSKQLMSATLQMPEKSTQAVLALLGDVSHAHGRKISSLWRTEERKGDGMFNALSSTVEGSNPFATTVWEGEILRRHFSPKVREGLKLLEKSIGST